MKKLLTLVLALTMGVSALFAQEYKQAVGLRIGYDFSLTYKTFVSQENFVDVGLNLAPFGGSFGITAYALYDWNFDIPQVDGLSWYVGPGASVGLHSHSFYVSVNGQIGLEYKFNNAPVAIFVDYAPGIYLGVVGAEGDTGSKLSLGFASTFGGLGVRYTF
mgnify:CR=1 FL=1